ncbi:hypothetical protein [Anaerobacillus alkalidiazotrophicus]|uniref:hypothetical protein n=1 Tax=Anaerobacillus alkalidiazotrophicus TaxID=472963 RepID=UPI00147184B5|nr:hypothetical protein [Anaerobacillus alkalidiazotrophicus]
MKLLLGLLRSGFATSKRGGTGEATRDQGACAFLNLQKSNNFGNNMLIFFRWGNML